MSAFQGKNRRGSTLPSAGKRKEEKTAPAEKKSPLSKGEAVSFSKRAESGNNHHLLGVACNSQGPQESAASGKPAEKGKNSQQASCEKWLV